MSLVQPRPIKLIKNRPKKAAQWSALPSNPKCVVVSVYYNRAHVVHETVASLLEQDLCELKILLVDDGSTDNTADELRKASNNDPRVEVVTHENRGFTQSIRDALADVDCDVIAVCGSGDMGKPNWLSSMLSELQSSRATGLVGCDYTNIGEQSGNASSVQIEIGPDAAESFYKRNRFSGGGVMFRKDVYDAVGGYRAPFKYSQDYDLWLRMTLVCDVAVVPEELYIRYARADGVSQSFQKGIIQRALADFARQCQLERIRSGADWVDRFGEQGLLFLTPSRAVMKDLARRASREILFSNDAKGIDEVVALSGRQGVANRDMAILKLLRRLRSKPDRIVWRAVQRIATFRRRALRLDY